MKKISNYWLKLAKLGNNRVSAKQLRENHVESIKRALINKKLNQKPYEKSTR